MDGEISKGTWVGATVLAIVEILGLSFAVYGISRSLVNNSSADFIKTVDSVSNSSFNDYDGTVVSGLQVRQALENYEGEKIGIWINTSGTQLAVTGAAKVNTDETKYKIQFVTEGDADFADKVLARQEGLGVVQQNPKGTIYSGRYYLNYNAVFEGITASNFKSTTQGYMEYTGKFALVTGTSDIVFNTVKTNYKNVACAEHIAGGSNFNAKLIKDGTGTIIGIMFTQVY